MSTASYFKDEAGVHLSLHLTEIEYSNMMWALLGRDTREAQNVRLLLAIAKEREETKATVPRFDDPQPLPSDGSQ